MKYIYCIYHTTNIQRMHTCLILENKKLFSQNLSNWYENSKRKLPWRIEPSLYKTVVSEFMLQQTKVKTVLPYFNTWLKKFPSFFSLANADEKEVLKHWEGLGYYNRCRNLHNLAKTIVQLNHIPEKASLWIKFKGIGLYTSAAISSIVFGEFIPVIDGNVIRVLSRITCCKKIFYSNLDGYNAFLEISKEIIHTSKNPSIYNQSIMELGATICLKEKPKCELCVVKSICCANLNDNWNDFPNIKKKIITIVEVNRLFFIKENKLLLIVNSNKKDSFFGIHELPIIQYNIRKNILEELNFLFKKTRYIGNKKYIEFIYTVEINLFSFSILRDIKNLVWIELKNLKKITLSGPHKRWINQYLKIIR